MSEWFMELVLKTSDPKGPGVRIPLSPPYLFLKDLINHGEVLKWLRGAPAKGVGRVTGARVQIPPSPPNTDVRLIALHPYFCITQLSRILNTNLRKQMLWLNDYCRGFSRNRAFYMLPKEGRPQSHSLRAALGFE